MEPAPNEPTLSWFDLIGLPIEVVEAILLETEAQAGMRLGLANRALLRWIDTSCKDFWLQKDEHIGLDAKSIVLKRRKNRVALACTVLRNLEDPKHANSYNILGPISPEEPLFFSMQSGAKFAVARIAAGHFCLIDFRKWPKYKVLETSADIGLYTEEVFPLGFMGLTCALFDASPMTIRFDFEALLKAGSLNESSVVLHPTSGRGIDPPVPHADRWLPFPSSQACNEKIAFIGRNAASCIACIFDASSNINAEQRWTAPVTLPNFAPNRVPRAAFDGATLVAWQSDCIAVFQGSMLLWSGSTPPGCVGPPTCAVSSEFLIILFHIQSSNKPASSNANRRKSIAHTAEAQLGLIRLDRLRDLDPRGLSRQTLHIIPLPADYKPFSYCMNEPHGRLALLVSLDRAFVLDLHLRKLVRSWKMDDNIISASFADSTLIVLAMPHAVVVMDLISDRRIWKTKKKKQSSSSTPKVT